MGIYTMDEATEGLTPQEVWARRAVYRNAKRILIDPSTSYEWNPRGYLERVEFKLGGYVQVLTARDDNGPIGDMFYLLFDETARLIEIEKRIEATKKPRTNWVHNVDLYHDGSIGIDRFSQDVRIYRPTEASMRRLLGTIDGLCWSWRPPTKLDANFSTLKNRALAPMRRF